MKQKLLVAALCSALLAIAGSASAQTYNQNHPQQRGQMSHQRAAATHQANRPAPKKYQGMYQQGRAEGWYRKGGRLPTAYRGNTYVVNNWSHYRLQRPPRGYHWVRSDNGQFLLVAITTGVISSIVTSMLTH